MPHGYQKRKDNAKKCEFCKTHNNGEQTRIDIEKIPDSDKWFVFVDDDRGSEELGRFNTKSEAKTAARNFMKQNPKGLSQSMNEGVIPGMTGAKNSFDFFG